MAMEEDPAWPFLMLGDVVQDFRYIHDREGYRMVECRRREAYGCGHNGDAIVRGLDLLVRLGRQDDPYQSPNLCIYASDEVMELVGSEIDDHSAKLYGRQLRLSAKIYTVSGGVMVIRISFSDSYTSQDFRSYYLVYDSAAASLSLLPRLPPSCRPACTDFPLVLKAVGDQEDEDKKYSLVLMAERSVRPSSTKYTHPVLCLWSPPPPPPSPHNRRLDYDNTKRAWDLKVRVRVDAFAYPFQANMVFLFKGTAVWGDLGQGILYCDCRGPDPVDFKHVMLPEECRISEDDMACMDHCSLVVRRTMGCVGDSIWFVIIQPNFTCPGDTVVKVWTLDLMAAGEEKCWSPHKEFKMLDLFRAHLGHHPDTVPKFPMVRRQQPDEYCALYMLLPDPYREGKEACGDLVGIDLSREPCLHSTRRLVIPVMNRPVYMDPDFFSSLGNYY